MIGSSRAPPSRRNATARRAASDVDRGATVADHCGEPRRQTRPAGDRRRPYSVVVFEYAWTAGGLVLTITPALPQPGLAFELVSTYTGHRDTDTIATHLILGQGRDGEIDSCRHPQRPAEPGRTGARVRLRKPYS